MIDLNQRVNVRSLILIIIPRKPKKKIIRKLSLRTILVNGECMRRFRRAAILKTAVGGQPRFLNMKGNPQDWLHTSTARPEMCPGPEHSKLYYNIFFKADQEEFLLHKMPEAVDR